MSLAFEIAVIVFLVVLNGCFAMSEMAIVSSRRPRLAAKAVDGSKGAALAMKLADNPGRFLSSVQVGITLIGILAGTYSGATLAAQLAHWIAAEIPALATASEALAIVIVVGAITYASLIVGELVPKQIALANPEGVAILVARPMVVVAKFVSPLLWVLEGSSQFILKVLGIRKSDNQTVTEEEVKAMIAEGAENGVIEPQEMELISGVMRFGDRKIRAIMTPRNDVVWIDSTWQSEEIVRTVRECRHSRFPVCQGGANEVIGVVQAKDLLDRFIDGKPFDVASVVKPIEAVHNNAPALHVLDILKQSSIHMALVVDEYGSVEGIVTAADILSSLLGGLAEHGEEYEGSIFQREDGSWLLDGDVAVDLAAEHIGCRVMGGEDGDYATIAGFILFKSRSIPSVGDHFEWGGWRFEVIDMDGRRIDKVLVSHEPHAQ